jgi:hypothetical protein
LLKKYDRFTKFQRILPKGRRIFWGKTGLREGTGKNEGRDKNCKLAERHQKRIQFWEGLLPVLNEKTNLFQNISPSRDNWLAVTTGVPGLYYYITIRMDSATLKVVAGIPKNREANKKLFDYLYERKDEIEETFGNELNWRRTDNLISSRIEYDIESCKLRDESTWKRGYILIADTLIKLDAAFRPHFAEMRKMRNIK